MGMSFKFLLVSKFGTIAMATAQQAAAVGLQHSQAGACETHLTHNAEDHQSARELICTFRPLVAEHINRSLNSHTTHETFVIMYAEDHDRLEFNGGKYADYLWPKAFNGETCTSPLELQEMPFLRQYGTDAISMVPPKEPIVVWDPEGTSPPGSRMYTLKVHIMRLLIVMATTRSDKLAVQAFDRDGNALKGSGYLSTDAPHNWPRTHGISQFGFNHFCSVLLFGALSHPMQCIMLHPQSHGRVGRGLDGFWGRVVNFSPKLGWHCAGASNVNSRLVTQDGRYPMPTSPEILQLHQLQNATTFTGARPPSRSNVPPSPPRVRRISHGLHGAGDACGALTRCDDGQRQVQQHTCEVRAEGAVRWLHQAW